MAQVWTTHITLAAAIGGLNPSPARLEGRASVGPFTRSGPLEQVGETDAACIGTLRVGFAGNEYPVERVRASISTPDNGIQLFGIDLPLVIAVPLPINVRVQALTTPVADINIIVAASEDVDAAADWGPTQSELIAAGVDYALEPWCQAVTIHNPDSRGEWFDSALASLGEFDGYRPRPRNAFFVRAITEDTTITQHYAS